VQEQEDLAAKGIASFAEVAAVRLEWFRARGDIVKEVMGWEIARVQLKLAQGVLALECCDQEGVEETTSPLHERPIQPSGPESCQEELQNIKCKIQNAK